MPQIGAAGATPAPAGGGLLRWVCSVWARIGARRGKKAERRQGLAAGLMGINR